MLVTVLLTPLHTCSVESVETDRAMLQGSLPPFILTTGLRRRACISSLLRNLTWITRVLKPLRARWCPEGSTGCTGICGNWYRGGGSVGRHTNDGF
ncbi:hypothetical protein PF005_g8148 [Phytophthora fragariae]|uniref:Secreted protein n=1 Tax=Phytophthora fragariae TaxID=53985 RepID=A0A6A3SKG5_9STRA|nr:hypothetical protein PF003_g12789 [Phytophthora fragariae]KAE8940856.1 hypothetical protein PF009_g9343 [Phytophthora fragariae]KAE9118777.1 hypothetical protein PF007_g8805 [Phytophthora fragariae]KAE9149809.1 hypothetical protein PF006_g5745 [Phytophthora fragariae]KAE9218750.1 hypothetical protein PF005_g8148 [Phytophthora fragariae]